MEDFIVILAWASTFLLIPISTIINIIFFIILLKTIISQKNFLYLRNMENLKKYQVGRQIILIGSIILLISLLLIFLLSLDAFWLIFVGYVCIYFGLNYLHKSIYSIYILIISFFITIYVWSSLKGADQLGSLMLFSIPILLVNIGFYIAVRSSIKDLKENIIKQ